MTPAEVLAAAADKLDALVEAATDGPWSLTQRSNGEILGIEGRNIWDEVITTGSPECMGHCYGGSSVIEATDADWRYIAALNPLVGQVMAELLRRQAEQMSRLPVDTQVFICDREHGGYGHGLAIARLIIGGEDPED